MLDVNTFLFSSSWVTEGSAQVWSAQLSRCLAGSWNSWTDARFPCPRYRKSSRTYCWVPPLQISFSRSVFVIFLLLAFSKVNSDGLQSFVIKKYNDKMENRGITEEGKGVSKDISVTVKQYFNWLIILVFCRSSTRNSKNAFFTGSKIGYLLRFPHSRNMLKHLTANSY